MVYDCIVIGAGVTGAFVTRQLSRYRLTICIVEKEADVAMGASKANSAIVHAGYDARPGTLKAKLNVLGSEMMEELCDELGVPYKRIGSLVLGFSENDALRLHALKAQGEKNGVKGLEILHKEALLAMEPNLSPEVYAALHVPTAAIVCPYRLTLCALENAVENGAELKLNCAVQDIGFLDDSFIVTTSAGEFRSRYLINAAGIYADTIAQMAGDDSFSIAPRKGEYMLYDYKVGNTVGKVVFQLPTEKGKGVLVAPTVDGNLLIGPNAEEIPDKDDKSTSYEGLEEVLTKAKRSVPGLSQKDVITSFAGLRAGTAKGDFIIQPSSFNHRLIHAAGIESPGLTAAPAIGVMVERLLSESGLELVTKSDFNPISKHRERLKRMEQEDNNYRVRQDPSAGRIVCRCESVTEAEILYSIRRTIGARDLDGVKRRTRAGGGRCQGGFCSCRVMEIMSRELGIPMEQVTKKGGGSVIVSCKSKQDLHKEAGEDG